MRLIVVAQAGNLSVSEFLDRARECAEIADKLEGADKQKMEIANEWLKLAGEAANTLKLDQELPCNQ
jgi:hypothetical protein